MKLTVEKKLNKKIKKMEKSQREMLEVQKALINNLDYLYKKFSRIDKLGVPVRDDV